MISKAIIGCPKNVPDDLERVRQGVLSVPSFENMVSECNKNIRSAVLITPPGTGKTKGGTNYINSGKWRQFTDFVVWLAPSWDAAHEMKGQLDKSLKIEMYPQRPNDCGEFEDEMKSFEKRGLGSISRIEFCPKCPNFPNCPYARYDSNTFGLNADVIIACDQRLEHNPRFILDLTEKRKSSQNPLVMIDEALSGNKGFVQTIEQIDIKNELAVVESLLAKGQLPLSVANKLLPVLRFDPHTKDIPSSIYPKIIKSVFKDVALEGITMFGAKYNPCLSKMANLPNEFCYWGDGKMVIQRRPWLPPTSIFLGAFLKADYLHRRYSLNSKPTVYGNDISCQHPDSKIIFIRSNQGFHTNFGKNKTAIIDFIADFIVRQISKGKRTVVLTKIKLKNQQKQLIVSAVEKRGFKIQIISNPEDVEKSTDISKIALLTYGKPGVNAYKNYDSIIALTNFCVNDQILIENAYPELEPKNRPKLTVETVNGIRTIGIPRDEFRQDRDYVESVLFRLEADQILQAIHRVRLAIFPREVVAFYLHHVPRSLGRFTEAKNLKDARNVLNLPSQHQIKLSKTKELINLGVADGNSIQMLASKTQKTKRTIQRELKKMGVSRPSGRPRKCDIHPL